jgi:hypothetical protein
MSELSSTLMSLLKDISRRPQMFESTPEAAHGFFVGLAAVLVHELSGRNIALSITEVSSLIKEVTLDVCESDIIPIMLCDESFFPERVSSFDALRAHSKRFIELLEAKYSTSERARPHSDPVR